MNCSFCEAHPEYAGYWAHTNVMCFPGQYFTLKDHPGSSYQKISLNGIRDLVVDPVNALKENSPATIGSDYCAHDARTHSVQAQHGKYSLLRFDIDSGNHDLEDICDAFGSLLLDNVFMVYSTSSATQEDRRWRVLVPLLHPVCHEVRCSAELVIRQEIGMLWGIDFDPVLDRAGQHIYLPAVAPHKRDENGTPFYYEWEILGERPLELEQFHLFPVIQDLLEYKKLTELRRQDAIEEQRSKKQDFHGTDDPKKSPIEWYNQNHPIEDLMVEIGYEQSPSDPQDWRSPLQTSGSFATRVYEDYFVTLSGSDAQAEIGVETRNGYRVGDSFSLFLHFIHNGDFNSAMREIRTKRDFMGNAVTQKIQNSTLLPSIVPISVEELNKARLTPRVLLPELLYADVRTRIAAGGSSKTTLATFEAVTLALGRPLWGRNPNSPIRTVFITREDSREILVARIRSVMEAMMLSEASQALALENIAVLDYTDISFRLSAVKDDVVVPHRENLEQLIKVLRDWRPDWVICDPLISFGVGESRVNDAEQGLIEAFRMLRNELNCCIEGVHHTGKAVARDKVLDQYAGRGGSALADGARMVVVMQTLNAKDWLKATGSVLPDGDTGFVMAFPKLSYCKPQNPIYIRRRGFWFAMVAAATESNPKHLQRLQADQVFEFLLEEFQHNRRYSRTQLESKVGSLKMSRQELRDALTELTTSCRVLYHEHRGRSGSHFEPVVINDDGNDVHMN